MAEQITGQLWHSLDINQVVKKLESGQNGLSSSQLAHLKDKYGSNEISTKKSSWIKRLVEPFTSLFIIVMLVAIVISLLTGEKLDAFIVSLVVIVNAVIFYFQQYSVNKVLADLKSREDHTVTVIRDSATKEIPSSDVVPGDVVLIFEGLKIPADGRIIDANALDVDESILTGESLPVHKNPDAVKESSEIYDQSNMLFKGTIVQTGSGRFIVTATANSTQLGSISDLAGKSDFGKAPIERKIDEITKKLVYGITVVGLAVFGLALARGISTDEALRFSLSLVVSIVPEGLPVVLTVVLLLSAKKMADRQALVKKLSAIETMGSVTLIATDKTGTLTENKLSLAERYPDSSQLQTTILGSITYQNNIVADPLDKVLLESSNNESRSNLVKSFPFDQSLRISGSLHKSGSHYILYIKGAPEVILKNGRSSSKSKQILNEFTKKGYRTIAFGHIVLDKQIEKIEAKLISKLKVDGIVGLSDPMRKSIPRAIKEAQNAGIKVVMLTGDHVTTAGEIAMQAGLATDVKQIATSALLETIPNKKVMATLLTRIKAFGRVLPRHKFNFLKAVKGTEVTAMTGDGVNDIPALVEADAGLAMGSGTDAAKDASDIVLLNDNFATIIEAIRLGRSVVANISKMLFYLISTSIGEAGTMIGALLLGLPLPVTAVQVLWINLVTDTFTVLPIGLSKPEKHQMKQPPRDPKAPLLTRLMLNRTLIAGSVIAACSVYIFWWLLPKGYAYAQTAVFISLVVAQWANALNANYEKNSWVLNLVRPNYKLWLGILVSISLQVLVFFGPLKEAFGIVQLGLSDLLFVILLPIISVLIAVDIHKLIQSLRSK